MVEESATGCGRIQAEDIGPSHRPPHLFVVGCPRSGTNLLRTMLDRHPRLALAFDTHFIPRVIELVSESEDPPLTPELVDKVVGYHRFGRLDLSEATARRAASGARTYGEFVSALYAEYGRSRGKPLVGEKTPDYVLSLPRLHALFPWARFVHLIRDGRDVALSTLQWADGHKGPARSPLWEEHPMAVCALWWRHQVGTGRRDGRGLPAAQYHEVRYEELVLRPRERLEEIAAFLQLPFAEEMLACDPNGTRVRRNREPKQSRRAPTPGLRDWRAQMAERDVALFEAIAGPLLSEFGYERMFRSFAPSIASVAEQCQTVWEAELTRHREKVARILRSTVPATASAMK